MTSLQQTIKCQARWILEELVPLVPASKVLNLGTCPLFDELSKEPLKYESAIKAKQNPACNPAIDYIANPASIDQVQVHINPEQYCRQPIQVYLALLF